MIRGMRLLWPLACLAACSFRSPAHSLDGPGTSDDGGGGTWAVIEMINVPASGIAQLSKRSLDAGVRYRLRASGTCYVGTQQLGDAEYFDFNNGSPIDITANVDFGIAVNDTVIDTTRMLKWGDYTDTHVYEVSWTGEGAPINLQLHDGNYLINTGMLLVEILEHQ